jgi:hypothetical protein
MPSHTRHDIMTTLTIQQIEELTGLPAPEGASPDEERGYRELAWENIKVDVESRDAQVPLDAEVDERP